jgi:hypothetical protein
MISLPVMANSWRVDDENSRQPTIAVHRPCPTGASRPRSNHDRARLRVLNGSRDPDAVGLIQLVDPAGSHLRRGDFDPEDMLAFWEEWAGDTFGAQSRRLPGWVQT